MYLFYIYLSLIVACILAIVINRRYFSHYSNLFLSLLIIVLAIESTQLLGNQSIDDFAHYFYAIIEVSLMGLIYRKVIRNKEINALIGYLILASIFLFAGITIKYGFGFNRGLFASLSHSLILVFSLIYVYESFKPPFVGKKIYLETFFWINSANLLFYAGSFLQMSLKESADILTELDVAIFSVIGKGLNYSLYSIYLVGFSCQRIFK